MRKACTPSQSTPVSPGPSELTLTLVTRSLAILSQEKNTAAADGAASARVCARGPFQPETTPRRLVRGENLECAMCSVRARGGPGLREDEPLECFNLSIHRTPTCGERSNLLREGLSGDREARGREGRDPVAHDDNEDIFPMPSCICDGDHIFFRVSEATESGRGSEQRACQE